MFTPNTQPGSAGAQGQQNQTSQQGQSGSRTGSAVVPEAKNALNNMKQEIAGELGINLKQGYNGDLTSRQAGYIGGYMVKRMIEQQERAMSQNQW